MNRCAHLLSNPQAQKIRAGVVADDIKVLLRQGLGVEVNISVENALLTRVQRLAELRSVRPIYHGEAAAGRPRVPEALQAVLLPVLLRQDLRADHDEAGALHGHDLGDALRHGRRDVVEPRHAVVGHVPYQGPARDVDVDVLGVLVVPQQGLRVLPAVETSDLAKGRLDDCLEGLGLAVAPVGALDVGGLDLAAVVDDGAGRVDEGLWVGEYLKGRQEAERVVYPTCAIYSVPLHRSL